MATDHLGGGGGGGGGGRSISGRVHACKSKGEMVGGKYRDEEKNGIRGAGGNWRDQFR